MKFLQFCSLTAIFASISPLRYKSYWPGYGGAGLAIAVGGVTLIVLMYVNALYNDLSREVLRMTMLLLFVLWAVCAGVCTFYGPFLDLSKCCLMLHCWCMTKFITHLTIILMLL